MSDKKIPEFFPVSLLRSTTLSNMLYAGRDEWTRLTDILAQRELYLNRINNVPHETACNHQLKSHHKLLTISRCIFG